jgi:hypothetical protein
VINDLTQLKYYSIRIVAVNKQGKGPESNKLEIIMKLDNILLYIWNMFKWEIVGAGTGLLFLLLVAILLCTCCCRKASPKKVRQSPPRRDVSLLFSYDNLAHRILFLLLLLLTVNRPFSIY